MSSERMVGEYSEGHLLKLSKKMLDEKMEKTRIFGSGGESIRDVPEFGKSELDIGRVLGRGGFCMVRQVNAVIPKEECPRNDNEENKYALKELNESSFKDVQTFVNGIVDLSMEAKWLGSIQHPNIIALHGVSADDPCSRNFFIIIDRLDSILTSRIQSWKNKNPSSVRTTMLTSRKDKKRIIWGEQIQAAQGIASALAYLHSKNIMHRDLKPDDVGFTAKGDVKLFDFGLARELPDASTADKNGCYNMTGSTGSIRYMSPEVALGKPYNVKTDVYSFGLLFHQILALQAPFSGITAKSFPTFVFEKGYRPVPDAKWPTQLSSMMKQCWSPTISERPSMEVVSNVLCKYLQS